MIDLHSHVLPGVDDGAETLEDSLAIARAAAAEGVRVLVATPHVRADYPTDAATIRRLLARLRAAVTDAGIPLELHGGGELALDYLPSVRPEDLSELALGGSRALLLETPYQGWPLDLGEVILDLRARGFLPLLAHPERNREVQERPERLRPLVDAGMLVQVTSASLEGRLGRRSRETGLELVRLDLAHVVASDAHAADVRAYGLRRGLDALEDAALARWLVTDVPAAVLAGAELPERPRRRRLFGLLSP